MRFHLITNPRVPVDPENSFDAFTTKSFIFAKTFSPQHVVFVYGPTESKQFFDKYQQYEENKSHGIIYVETCSTDWYDKEVLKDPRIMLVDNPCNALTDKYPLLESNTKDNLTKNYVFGDVVIHLADSIIIDNPYWRVIYSASNWYPDECYKDKNSSSKYHGSCGAAYSCGDSKIWYRFGAAESKYLKSHIDARMTSDYCQTIYPLMNKDDFPDINPTNINPTNINPTNINPTNINLTNINPTNINPTNINLIKQDKTLLYLGRCSEGKGITVMFELAERLPDYTIIISGQAIKYANNILTINMRDNSLKDYDLSQYSNVQYVGISNPTQRNALLRSATALIQVSFYDEPCGYNAIEAQYCGLPVICRNTGAYLETVVHGKTGFLVSTDINDILYYIPRLSTISSQDCQDNVKIFFDDKRYYEEYMRFFKTIIEKQIKRMVTIETKVMVSKENLNKLKTMAKFFEENELSHFLWEPHLIIRNTFNNVAATKELLFKTFDENCIRLIYDYPSPLHGFGESVPLVRANLDYFIQLFHIHSVMALKLDKADNLMYQDRAIHTMYNMNGQFRLQEGESLMLRGAILLQESLEKRAKFPEYSEYSEKDNARINRNYKRGIRSMIDICKRLF